jgi:hypothetical protein
MMTLPKDIVTLLTHMVVPIFFRANKNDSQKKFGNGIKQSYGNYANNHRRLRYECWQNEKEHALANGNAAGSEYRGKPYEACGLICTGYGEKIGKAHRRKGIEDKKQSHSVQKADQ